MTPGKDDYDDPILPEAESSTDEADLWFLPGPIEDEDFTLAPLPRADRRALFDPEEWLAAQNGLSEPLSRLSQAFGELDSRLRGAPKGLRLRLALQEAADQSWWAGARFPAERLGLWLALRVGSTAENEEALSRGGWAVRRLTEGPPPSADIPAFLDRDEDRGGGEAWDLTDLLLTLRGLHPVTQSAILFHAWRLIGPETARDLEAAVLAARHGAAMSRLPGRGASFLPLASGGPGALQGQGEVPRKLAAWIAGAEQSVLSCLLQLDRLRDWRARADAATADLSGRVPALLLDVIEGWPLVPAPLAEAETGASRAAVQRNLDRLVARELVTEVTGQGRFRIWRAAL
ncbi:hypothetical protein [Pararhodobacter sp. CCB-MM2]|uniref:hypothetical protein n=1 Tax=Pararhodobacter sp. CCB-MM2 TaxID=1786003 RepID=UPI00082ED2C7|nr:hypothetical protein [Pararhodobacter sp. CCB-MM2]